MALGLREIEKKLYTEQLDLTQIASLLTAYAAEMSSTGFLAGTGKDYYWGIENKPHAFYRVRERDGVRQLTYKEEDKGNPFDRFEGDLSCFSPLDQCIDIATKQYGEQRGTIFKFFYVHFFNDSKWDTICCYSVDIDDGETDPRIYIEVEGRDTNWIMERVEDLRVLVPGLQDAPGSLWTMYFRGNNV